MALVIINAILFYNRYFSKRNQTTNLGQVAGLLSPPTPTTIPSLIPPDYSINLVDAPTETTEGDTVSFTWNISGPPKTINTTAIYYGTKSQSGSLTRNASPDDTGYTSVIDEFIKGNYNIPLQFVGNNTFTKPGTFFFRGYALIDGKHYWTKERSLVVKPLPKHEIRIDNPPTSIKTGESTTFTWDISGPTSTTQFTAIVAGKESKSGPLADSVSLSDTPYKTIVKEFTSGTYNIPLRFIGNVALPETGVHYFRAHAVINNKNIWSDEYSLTVQ
ncbi:hypothetical protein A2773_01785 [Candidatus Gottesmanbacteria bacterium RIFCSPHIGHO2_01_FULL_39_10]|uniref:Uncharacterized protein n=1 Tax=Candidatus Gottesmanbacteria bacterium RIFCSPHIGHO2_01_FULL_39_10 TaxID=1798375 RepID=A0A1F5ZKB0_9BACT|nr:MAG: hypothetical protein A2773_01785 [Candidatus Gottesmanbacteria bacterium RIFCSPHIGHO2_01_FULL_39_10]